MSVKDEERALRDEARQRAEMAAELAELRGRMVDPPEWAQSFEELAAATRWPKGKLAAWLAAEVGAKRWRRVRVGKSHHFVYWRA
jgi:NADPH-dependent ferric siderophore reductase